MASQRQIEANRLNAQASTGPRTAEGKAASSGNALTHGLTARTVLLAGEDPEGYRPLRESMIAELGPEGALESELVAQTVMADAAHPRLRSRADGVAGRG